MSNLPEEEQTWWEEFEKLCQTYRHAPYAPQDAVCLAYTELCDFVSKRVWRK
jgi:hypothetical protein